LADRFDGEPSEAAERYAQAAFELAKEASGLDALEKDFAAFLEVWRESDELRAAARSPLIDPSDKARALVAVAEKVGLSELGRKVIGAAAANRRAGELPSIITAFRAKHARHRGAQQIEIVSAAPLPADQRDIIVNALAKQLGGKVDAAARVDESLIGGFVVRVGSRQFDASVKSKLDALKRALKTA
jgi:F-type H+-transporting ATPase subunit delta